MKTNQITPNGTAPKLAENYRIYDLTGGGVTHDIHADSLEDAIEQGREWIEDGDWSGDEQQGVYRTIALDCCVRKIVRYDDSEDDGEVGEIDERATAAGQSYDCGGTYTPEESECDSDGEVNHDWTSDDGAPVGGIMENPGVWSLGGTRMKTRTCCRHCGRYRVETDPGCQRNSDEAMLVVRIEDADEASEAWIASAKD
jgi:hypothetical protein